MTRDPLPFRAGQTLGRYELLAPIAKGGMGQVWAGRLRGARGFHKLVAIKTILPAHADSARLEQMLFEEARIASLIQHANVVQTLELGEQEGALYLVMEWVEGEPLSHLVRSCGPMGGMPLLVAVNLVGQTLRGLQAAHELCNESGAPLGVVHRDVSPHNVLVSYSGVAKLLDFGIAKAMNQHESSTSTGEIKGKFAYMAPEQILGRPVDQRADLFALGIVLYQLTSGQHPFKNHDSAGVLHSISSSEPAPRPSLLQAGYSRLLEAVVMKAIEKDPNRRWSSADEMRLALQRAIPEAFRLGFETHLARFMADTVGARATEKREALRRAELASEARFKEVSLSGAAPSAGSLRAVSVSDAYSESEQSRRSRSPTERPLPELAARAARKSHRVTFWIACVSSGLLLVFGLLWATPSGLRERASGSGIAMAELPASPRRAAHPSRAPETIPAAVPSAAASVTIAADPVQGPAAELPKQDAAKPGRPHARSKGSPGHLTDLIAPDYAR